MTGSTDEPRSDQPARRPSIKDVAERAGVSFKTVSNVIHQPDRVRPGNRKRVQDAIRELGYRTSLTGRQLREGRSRVISLAVPDITSPYFAALARQFIRAAAAVDHTVLIDDTGGDPEREKQAAGGYAVQFADGVVLSPQTIDSSAIAQVHPHNPVVVLGERDLTLGDPILTFDHVAIDNVRSAKEATDHLVATGRRHLVFVGASDAAYGTGMLRHAGFTQSLEFHGLQSVAALPVEEWDRAGGEAAVAELLASGTEVDALVCGNDLIALGAMRAIRAHGRVVGQDLAVLGWDDTDEGRYAEPALTSVAPDLAGIARTTLRTLLDRIEGSADPARLHTVPHRLAIRASTDGRVQHQGPE